ncbi:DNA-binding transcriptional regulator, MocR family, contains an aminotransferase domain [Variovorax sp. HW608]|uniref:aminotransferase-like domain-containing protein n=1 Tax=Variovorax sp. HW608 TaxID=1034889 RepID=UPI00081FACC5|nr:PLP-dependent aminotransferase family protein [Variovorax sp. HW608]SCK07097.1 DNA-binding transcriptional regulator, MocR family, contains an aminotransferase domain [Variovorax sp. HW608]
MLILRPELPTPLVSQIVEGLRGLISTQKLKADTKLPSIRAFAAAHGVSVFTVVEAYDRLVAQGLLVSRANAGFFVKRRSEEGAAGAAGAASAPRADPRFDARWYLQQIFENRNLPLKAGCGWLPHDWLFEDGMRRSLRHLASEGADIGGYGLPFGHLALRMATAEALSEQQIVVDATQVLLTQGSSQALDLIARRLLKPGDSVLVDDPGYPNLMFMLRFLGVNLIGVPRIPSGYDMPALEALLALHRPKAFFTQPRLQSPTCSTATLPQLVQLLQLAQAHDFTLVENDIYAELDASMRPSLASLAQLRQVVYVSSFSKTISPNLRVGYVVAQPELLEELAQLKMISGLTSSDITERLVFGTVTDGRWRKHLKALRERLAHAHGSVARRLSALGFELFHEAAAGMYLWARHPDIADSAELSRRAALEGIMLGPGQLFLVNPHPTGWLRFNVSFSDDERLWRFLERSIAHQGGE